MSALHASASHKSRSRKHVAPLVRRAFWQRTGFSAGASLIGLFGAVLGAACALVVPLETPTPLPLPTATLIPVITPERTRPTPTPQVFVFPTPTATAEPGNPPATDGQPTLILTRPQAGQRVRSPLAVEGTAIVFEGVVNVVLRDSEGRTLQEGATAATSGAPERGSFALSLAFVAPSAEAQGVIEVFTRSARDGSVLHRLRVPVIVVP